MTTSFVSANKNVKTGTHANALTITALDYPCVNKDLFVY